MKKTTTKEISSSLFKDIFIEFGSRKGGSNPPPSTPRPNIRPEGQGPRSQKPSK